MSISSMWDQYFNHYQPRQTEITKVKLATLNDVRKNWIRNISLCIKLLKCELIQILKRSLNLRDCLSHFDFKKLILQMSLFFLFIAISSVSHPTGSNGRYAKKKDYFFALWRNDITVVSLFPSYCYFIQEARHRFPFQIFFALSDIIRFRQIPFNNSRANLMYWT